MPALSPDQEKYMQDSARLYQSYYDTALRTVGMRAPAPILIT
jgi:hypothetical protein